ncbi:hypothetical protein H5410_050882 [Solanum commersonii]|uniref:Uncharacterized protein n=1 Tax=Solanum commersonii TaxID=4109 RepID=A0A9J5WY17_SOLCO|nr:hypothetical protein H5410_050882 [Solanum commersonii]
MTRLDYSGGKFSLEQHTPNQLVSKQAKSEEYIRPKTKFLELKPFESSTNHSASLVKIVDQLGDPPFGRFHRCIALSFSIVVFWIIGRHSTASQNYSATRRPLLFTADLILSFRAQQIGKKCKDMTFWRLAEQVRQFSDLHFFVLSVAFVPFC